jgi:NDMA-dependent alcohol dehydrogenase
MEVFMTTNTSAAILWEVGKEWSVEEITLDPPRSGEVLVRIAAAGLCHSDEHILAGDLPFTLPMVGGHEGAGIVEEVGVNVTDLAPGDKVIFMFVPACGICPSCSTGHQNLCDLGSETAEGLQPLDRTSRHHAADTDLRIMCGLGTFAHHTVVNAASCVKVDASVDLTRACLLGCGAVTGWGSSVYAADVQNGDAVVVVGTGGIGMSAVQGARMAGAQTILAIDPEPFKRESALRFGATLVANSMIEAIPLLTEATHGRMANKVIMTMGVGRGEHIAEALALTGKRGRVVVTNMHPAAEIQVSASFIDLMVMEKQIVGSLFGSANPRADIPKLLALADSGQFDLDRMITQTYPLEGINEGYQAMRDSRNIRGVLVLDH